MKINIQERTLPSTLSTFSTHSPLTHPDPDPTSQPPRVAQQRKAQWPQRVDREQRALLAHPFHGPPQVDAGAEDVAFEGAAVGGDRHLVTVQALAHGWCAQKDCSDSVLRCRMLHSFLIIAPTMASLAEITARVAAFTDQMDQPDSCQSAHGRYKALGETRKPLSSVGNSTTGVHSPPKDACRAPYGPYMQIQMCILIFILIFIQMQIQMLIHIPNADADSYSNSNSYS